MRRILSLWLLLGCMTLHAATEGDSARHVGYTVFTGPAWQIAMDEYERKFLRNKQAFIVGAELNYSALPSDSDAFAVDYNYPTLSLGAKLSLNNGVTMRRTEDPSWGKAQMVDYDSHLGNIATLYGSFSRPLLRQGRWQLDYTLRAGVGYNTWRYNKTDNIDNELIGSLFTIYFGAGLVASYQFSDRWGLTAGVLFGHHSNGALARPNKGENHVGPFVGIHYAPYDKAIRQRPAISGAHYPFQRYWYANIRLGIGGKTLLEEWQRTQFQTPPDDPEYRTEDFQFYMAYSAEVNAMYRYARRWASGIGVDLFYGSYADRVRELDEAAGHHVSHSPWSLGISAKHEAYYHNLSVDVALGYYLYRQMGVSAKSIEKPYYEQVGVFYTFPQLYDLKIGVSVKAHSTKADLTELAVSIPIRFKRGQK